MNLKLNMDHQGLMVYTTDINDDSSLTLTYFTVRSSLVKIAYFAYTRGMDRTIGDSLVIHYYLNLVSNIYSFYTMVYRLYSYFQSDSCLNKEVTFYGTIAYSLVQGFYFPFVIYNSIESKINRKSTKSSMNILYPGF